MHKHGSLMDDANSVVSAVPWFVRVRALTVFFLSSISLNGLGSLLQYHAPAPATAEDELVVSGFALFQ